MFTTLGSEENPKLITTKQKSTCKIVYAVKKPLKHHFFSQMFTLCDCRTDQKAICQKGCRKEVQESAHILGVNTFNKFNRENCVYSLNTNKFSGLSDQHALLHVKVCLSCIISE